MYKVVLKDTMNPLVLVEELRHRKDGKQHEGMVQHFHLEVHDNVGKADKQWVGNLIASHSRDIGPVWWYQSTQESGALWQLVLSQHQCQ